MPILACDSNLKYSGIPFKPIRAEDDINTFPFN